MRIGPLLTLSVILGTCSARAEAPVELSETSLEASAGQYGIVVLAINWGRHWGCAGIDNAQLQALTFTRRPEGPTLELRTPSRLFVDDRYNNLAVLVEPGVWDLTDFDVKVAESSRKVGHVTKSNDESAGSFEVAAGEFVYIGHFSLDCSEEAIPWRYYVLPGSEFGGYADRFLETYPYVGDIEVRYGLFVTEHLGGALPES
jgi:hypothetical protein